MDDLHVTIHHKAHWEWVAPRDGVQPGEAHIVPNPAFPDWVLVKRLVPENSSTELVIPGESAQRMANERAALHGAGVTTRRHLHDAIAHHVQETMHKGLHAPVEHWRHIEVTGDDALQTALHARFIEDT